MWGLLTLAPMTVKHEGYTNSMFLLRLQWLMHSWYYGCQLHGCEYQSKREFKNQYLLNTSQTLTTGPQYHTKSIYGVLWWNVTVRVH